MSQAPREKVIVQKGNLNLNCDRCGHHTFVKKGEKLTIGWVFCLVHNRTECPHCHRRELFTVDEMNQVHRIRDDRVGIQITN